MNEMSLTVFALIFIALAAWRNSASAVWFGVLAFGHGIFLGDLATSDPMTYMATAGICSTLSVAACYGFRKDDNDLIAKRMMGISALCLLVNIICIAVWLMGSPMEGFNWVFAGLLLTSIAVIIKGDAGGHGATTGSNLDRVFRANTDKHSDFLVELENREAPK